MTNVLGKYKSHAGNMKHIGLGAPTILVHRLWMKKPVSGPGLQLV